MVGQLHIEQRGGFFDLLGEGNIVRRWFGAAGRVIVAENNVCGITQQGKLEDFFDVDRDRTGGANTNQRVADATEGVIEQHEVKELLVGDFVWVVEVADRFMTGLRAVETVGEMQTWKAVVNFNKGHGGDCGLQCIWCAERICVFLYHAIPTAGRQPQPKARRFSAAPLAVLAQALHLCMGTGKRCEAGNSCLV